MTDNEIMKALECCSTYKGKCTDCPAFVKVDRSNCKQVLLGAIKIINHLQAENERLNNLCQEQNTEISRLQKVRINILKVMRENIEQTKTEAYKEFAERLKKKSKMRVSDIYGKRVFTEDIDNLLNKLVGDSGETVL